MRELDRIHPEVSSRFTNYRDIIGFRTLLVHLYDKIKDKNTWKTVENDISLLEEEAERLLQEFD